MIYKKLTIIILLLMLTGCATKLTRRDVFVECVKDFHGSGLKSETLEGLCVRVLEF